MTSENDLPNKEEIIAYLNEAKDTVLHTKTILLQIKQIIDWRKNDPNDEAGTSGQFFGYVFMCFYRVIVLECYKLIWGDEDFNIGQLLNTFSRNWEKLEPKGGDDEIISKHEYIQLIREQKKELKQFKLIKKHLKELRNNLFAHTDKKYHLKKGQVGIDFPVSWLDLEKLLNLIGDIVRKHYSLLTDADIDMRRIHSGNSARKYLVALRFAERVRSNDNLKNLRMTAFQKDDYDPDDIFWRS